MRDFILTSIKFTNSKLFLQAIFHSLCPWPITNWRNSNRMSSKRRWREWLNPATITISYPSQEVWVKAITRGSIQQFHLYSICLFYLQMQSIVKAVVSPGSSVTIVSSWNMLKVERVPMALPSAVWIQMDTQIAQLPQTTNIEKYKSTLLFYLLTIDPAIFINTSDQTTQF